MDTVDNAITEPVRRLEVFTGAGRRRTWSDEDKARIVAEIVTSGDSVCAVARRHGLSPQQLFGWRRQLQRSCRLGILRRKNCSLCRRSWMWPSSAPAVRRQRKAPRCKAEPDAGTIEVEIDGVTVRVGRGADAKTIAAVLRALKAGA